MESTPEKRSLTSALAYWDLKRDPDALSSLQRSIPIDFINTDLPNLLRALVIFLSRSSQGRTWDVDLFLDHLHSTDGIRHILQNLSHVQHTPKDRATIDRSLVANMDRICSMMSHTVEGVSFFRPRWLREYNREAHFGHRFLDAVLHVANMLATWDGTAIYTAFCKNRHAATLLASAWALNSETNSFTRPREPPNLIRVKDLIPFPCLLNAMRLYLPNPTGRRLVIRSWFERCTDGTLYGSPADPASLLATSFRARLDVIRTRIRDKFDQDDYIDFELLSRILFALIEDDGMKDFPTVVPAMWKSGTLRVLLEVGQRLSAVALATDPDFRVGDPLYEDSLRILPVPLGVLTLAGSVRKGWKPKVNDHVRSIRQDLADGWLDILVDALVALPLLPNNRCGAIEESVRVEMEQLLTAAVSYPSLLYAVEKALKGISAERAAKASRVSMKGAPLRAPYIFVYFKEEIFRHVQEHRKFLQRQSHGDIQTVVCDNAKHSFMIGRRIRTGGPKMKALTCSGCHVYMYCSQECQSDHWTDLHWKQCSDYAYQRAASDKAHVWYRSSYRVWHLYLQTLVCDVALAAGPWHITILDYTQAHHLTPTVYPISTYPHANLGASAQDPWYLFSSKEPAADMRLQLILRSAGPMTWPWLRRPGMKDDELPIVRLIEGVYPWKEQGADGDGACMLVMGQYLITPSESPERDWDIELITTMTRVWRGRKARKARKKPELAMADLD